MAALILFLGECIILFLANSDLQNGKPFLLQPSNFTWKNTVALCRNTQGGLDRNGNEKHLSNERGLLSAPPFCMGGIQLPVPSW